MTTLVPPIGPDPSLGGVRELFTSEGEGSVATFLRKRGFEPQSLRPIQALYRPGSSCIVRYRVRCLDPDGLDRHISVCSEVRAKSKEPVPVPGSFAERHRFPDPVERDGPYLVWAFPYDPALKTMTDAAWGPWAKSELIRSGQTLRAVSVQPVMYRPRRRAMFRYVGVGASDVAQASYYAKVLRTPRLNRSVEVSQALQPKRSLVPWLLKRRQPSLKLLLPLAEAGSNALLFRPAPGRSLRDLLLRNEPLPHPSRIVEVMQEIATLDPRGFLGASPRHSRAPTELVETTGELIVKLLPEAAGTVRRIGKAVERGGEARETHRCLVHGDLYDGQIFIDGDFSLTLIDLDDVGVGDPAQDVANFCAHLLVMAMSNPEAKERLTAYRSIIRQEFSAAFGVSPETWAWREALVVMQLAVGPFRILNPRWPEQVLRRLDLAARLC